MKSEAPLEKRRQQSAAEQRLSPWAGEIGGTGQRSTGDRRVLMTRETNLIYIWAVAWTEEL